MRCLLFFLSSSLLLQANPRNLSVAAGEAHLSEAGNVVEIVVSDRAILHWESFSISPNETTRFVQPAASSAVLNRVVGTEMSQLHGLLHANGQVYLVNPHGVIIGKEGQIHAAAVTACARDINAEDFLNNHPLRLSGDSSASVCNLGVIETSSGPVSLIAHKVENAGTVKMPVGYRLLLQEGDSELFIYPDLQGPENPENMAAQIEGKPLVSLAINQGGPDATELVFENGATFLKKRASPAPNSGSNVMISAGGAVAMGGNVNATGGGEIAVTAGTNLSLSSGISVETDTAAITLIAGTNIGASGATTIQTTDASGTVTLVVDNDNPNPPNIGSGAFTLPSGTTLSSGSGFGKVLLYAASPGINTFPSTINGATYTPGTGDTSKGTYVAGTNEFLGYWYNVAPFPPDPSFEVIFKSTNAQLPPPPTPPVSAQTVQTALVEPVASPPQIAIQSLKSSMQGAATPDPSHTCGPPTVSIRIGG